MPTRSATCRESPAGFSPSSRADSPVGLAQALDAFDSGRLAGTVWSDHAKDLTLAHFEGNPVDGDDVPVGLPQVANLYDRRQSRGALSS